MNIHLAYHGHSGMNPDDSGGQSLNLKPNLARDPVAFDAPLLKPLRFREAISALHDVVISDLRFKPRDKSAYEAWKVEERRRISAERVQVYNAAYKAAKEQALAAVPPGLEEAFSSARKKYWSARDNYSNYIYKTDYELWRSMMPLDPVITVSDDVLFFECFSADESSYGCLTVDRDAFGKAENVKHGTTNVDYSWNLYNHFQSLRTYRETRFRIDPEGFEVATRAKLETGASPAKDGAYREEKIDLPDGWLRGFFQLQAAMGLPMRRVSLSREAVYSVLAFLRRNKARKSPRALRFELLPGKAPVLILEPWEKRIVSEGTRYDGPGGEPIRVWGKQRLLALARLLPLADNVDVYLLGTGLPSFWVVRMGEMRLTLGLSGWTTNDWTKGSSLDLLAPPTDFPRALVYDLSRFIREKGKATFDDLRVKAAATPLVTAAALNHLAHSGQIIKDLTSGVYRWRQVVPRAEGEDTIFFAPENPELEGSREILAALKVKIDSRQEAPKGGLVVTGKAEGKPVELATDSDGNIKRGKCVCSHHYVNGIRKGPCRHLLALRALALRNASGDVGDWYERLMRWAKN